MNVNVRISVCKSNKMRLPSITCIESSVFSFANELSILSERIMSTTPTKQSQKPKTNANLSLFC